MIKVRATLFFAFAIIFASTLASPLAKAASFTPNNIIDNSVFDDVNTMTPVQIDAFLNGFPSSCISPNSGFRAIDPTGYSQATGYTFGGYVTAGQVIYDAAKAYGLNPQVLVVTLEKEQSLVSGRNNFAGYCNNGDEHKYAAALGFGCPDSPNTYSYTGLNLYQRNGVVVGNVGPTCVNSVSKAGFSQQVIRAAWLLTFGRQRAEGNTGWAVINGSWNNTDDLYSCYGGPMTQGNYRVCPNGQPTYYDGYVTIDGVATHMDNGATAALYWYTPHFHGNELFSTLFQSYFGSVIGSYLVRTPADATVYLLSGNNKYPIGDSGVLQDFTPLGQVKYVSDTYLSAYSQGPMLGHMVGGQDGTLYFIDGGIKLPFSSCGMVAHFGYSCSSVTVLPNSQLSKFATGPYITQLYKTVEGKMFYIVNGTRRQVFDQKSQDQAGLSGPYNALLERGISYLPYDVPIIRDGVVVKNRSGGSYVYDSSNFWTLNQDLAAYRSVQNLPSGYLDNSSIPSAMRTGELSGLMNDTSNGVKYVLTSTGKGQLAAPTTWSAKFQPVSSALISSLPAATERVESGLVKSGSDGTVYYMFGGQKRPIQSWDDLIGLKPPVLSITTLANTTINSLTTGATVYSPGRLVKTANSGTVYIVKSPSELLPLSTFAVTQDLGLTAGIGQISITDLGLYTIGQPAQTRISCGGSNYVGIAGSLLPMSTNQMTQYGFLQTDFADGGAACLNAPKSSASLTDFIRTPDGTIYRVQNGQKQAFTGYSIYLAYGGSVSNTVPVSSYFAALIKNGNNLSQ